MPRVSAAHEQGVRDRILGAAMRVFAEKGYHSSTIADVVRESGLSVGAIYTYFSGKDELIRLTCDQIAARGLDELAARLAPATTTAERLAIAVRLYIETIDEYEGAPGQVTLVQAWAEADREPGVREMLAGRRERFGRRRSAAPPPGRHQWRTPGLARRRRRDPRLPGPARRPDAPAHRGRRRLPAGRSRAARDGDRGVAPRARPGVRPDRVASRAVACSGRAPVRRTSTTIERGHPTTPDDTRVNPVSATLGKRDSASTRNIGLWWDDRRTSATLGNRIMAFDRGRITARFSLRELP